MVTKVAAGGVHGIEGYLVNVEADISDGMPSFEMSGNLGSEVKEARDRVRTALKNAGFYLPVKRITINFSPSDRRKYGTGYDLPVAISVLCAMGEVKSEIVEKSFFAGELMLSGDVRGVRGILPMIIMAKNEGYERCIVPKDNVREAAVVKDIDIIGIENLKEAIEYLRENISISSETHLEEPPINNYEMDMSFINGQLMARRGMEIAVAGRHNILLMGPPGAGKTMLAKCIPSIMPPLTLNESLKISSIYSVGGLINKENGIIRERPFVAPHHTATDISLIGGGARPRPGAVSLASKGVLFMDEFPEFSRTALEVLRQPLEDGKVVISRNLDTIEYPADFMLVAAMNPCPCGAYPDLSRCICTASARQKYLNKLSKPLLDRIDICLQVEKVKTGELLEKKKNESSKTIRQRVEKAYQIQKERFKNTSICFNSQMSNKEIEKYVFLGERERHTMSLLTDKYKLSARGYYRMLRVSRTIADLHGKERVGEEELFEAVRLKCSMEIQREVN